MRMNNRDPSRHSREQPQERFGPIKVVQDTAAKNHVERLIILQVPNIIVDELEIRKCEAVFDEHAIGEVARTHLEPDRLGESQARKLDGESAFQAAEVRNSQIAKSVRIKC